MLAVARDRFLTALQYRDYRIMWTASLSAGAAAWALIVARGWLAYEFTDSSAWVGLVTFAAMAPRFFATPLLGFLADRFDRQTLVSATYALNLAHNIALALLVMFGLAGPWLLVALALVNGTLRSAQMTSTQALLPNLLPRQHLLNAVALNEATQQGSRLFGPLAIAPLLAWASVDAAFWLCSAFYLVGLIQTLRIKTRSTGRIDRSRGMAGNVAAGFSYVYQQNPMVLTMILITVGHCSLVMSFESLLPAISDVKLHAGSAGVSYLMMGVGAGALTSAVLLAGVRNDITRGKLFLLLGFVSGLAPVALALTARPDLAIAAAVLLGASQAGFMTITHTVIQSIVDDGFRGRVSGVYSMHVGGSMALANLGNGVLADWLNAPLVMLLGGALFLGVMAVSVIFPSLRRIYFPPPNPAVVTV